MFKSKKYTYSLYVERERGYAFLLNPKQERTNMSDHCDLPQKKTVPSCCTTEKEKTDFFFWGALIGVAVFLAFSFWMPAPLASQAWLVTMAETTQFMFFATWWGVVIGFVFVGMLSKIPRAFIMALFGEGGTFGGIMRATGAGVLLDLCSHGILMVGAKLYERGASAGQVIAFLLASPWNSFSLTLILIGLIGLKLTLLFIALSMVIAIITGYIFDRFVNKGILPANPNKEELPEGFLFWPEVKKGIKKTTFNYVLFKEMAISGIKDSRMVLKWLLFGVLLAGVLRAVFTPDMFQDYFGPTFVGLMLTIMLTTVLEVCSEGSAPIAADIVTRAGAPGNGFAFLMAGVATDYTEIMVIKETMKSWKLALFLPLISVPQVLLVSWLINVGMR